jgi:hypothetical protein
VRWGAFVVDFGVVFGGHDTLSRRIAFPGTSSTLHLDPGYYFSVLWQYIVPEYRWSFEGCITEASEIILFC